MSGITLSNSREQIKSEIIELVDKVVSASKKLPLPEKQVSRSGKNFLWKVNEHKDEVVLEVKEELSEIIDLNMDQIEKVVDLFRQYSFIITQNKEIKAGLDLEMTKLEYQA